MPIRMVFAGTWASSVSSNYLRDASVEWDFYTGYLKQLINSRLVCLFLLLLSRREKHTRNGKYEL